MVTDVCLPFCMLCRQYMLPCFTIQWWHWGALEKVCKCDVYHRIVFLCGTPDLTLRIGDGAHCCFLPVISYVTAFKNNLSYASIFILVSFCPYFYQYWNEIKCAFAFQADYPLNEKSCYFWKTGFPVTPFVFQPVQVTQKSTRSIYMVKSGFLTTFFTVT